MLIGDGVTLLPFHTRYQDSVLRWVNDDSVRLGTGKEGPVSDAQHSAWWSATSSDHNQRVFVIGEGCGESATPVGLIGLKNIDWRSRHAEYWIYLGESGRRGNGIGRRATILLLDHAFRCLNLHRIYLFVGATNHPAISLYDRVGFCREGVLREHRFVRAAYEDMVLMAVLSTEFLASSGEPG